MACSIKVRSYIEQCSKPKKRQYKPLMLFLAFSCQVKWVEDNKKTESGPILGNSQSNNHVLDQQYSQFLQKSVGQKSLWWSMKISYEMYVSASAEYSGLAKVMQTGEEYSALAKTCCIWCEIHTIFCQTENWSNFVQFRPYFCLIQALLAGNKMKDLYCLFKFWTQL